MKKINKKGLILITGIPASGKSYFSLKLQNKLNSQHILCNCFSIDCLQSFLNEYPQKSFSQILHFCKNKTQLIKIKNLKLNKQNFKQVNWKNSRQYVETVDFLELLFQNCQILIIQDQFSLKSQRKPFKKFCCERQYGYLQIEMKIKLEQAIQNNVIRGKQSKIEEVPQQFILKSLQKFQNDEDRLVVTRQNQQQILKQINFISRLKQVVIKDNYKQFLEKKQKVYQKSQKELDQNQLRRLISRIMKEEQISRQYFGQDLILSNNKKAQILSECKKLYIQNKRKTKFKQILKVYMQTGDQKEKMFTNQSIKS